MSQTFEESFPAIGTTAQVVTTSSKDLSVARSALDAELEAIDRACSRFRDDSELSLVNAAMGVRVEVTPLFVEALRVALRAARVTRGLVDPTVGRALVAIGYDRDFASIRQTRSVSTFEPTPGWRFVELDEAASTVRVPPGIALDLGATAKALAADRGARAASERTGNGVLVNLGGDIAVAGCAPKEGWPVRVTHDHRTAVDASGQTISLRSGGLATSSTTVRRWRTPTGFAHHIVDPSTGKPAREVWETVSVAAATCVDANTAATAAIVMGSDAPLWLAAQDLPSRLVDPEGNVVGVAGWPKDGP
jgi:thiamine biosynthesis lipoprotein